MLSSLKSSLAKHISNIPGWSTNRKIVVFLVDDWGAIRIKDREAFNILREAGVNVEANRFNRYDSIERAEDLEALFEVLSSVKDADGRPAVFTALSTVANPDFKKIADSNFTKFYFETFDKTLERLTGDHKTFNLLKSGIDSGIFSPEFHGREHLNVKLWLKALQSGDTDVLKAFSVESVGLSSKFLRKYRNSYLAAYDFESLADLDDFQDINDEGIKIFKSLFGVQPVLFTSSGLLHHEAIEPHLVKNGIRFVDRGKVSYQPRGGGQYKKAYFTLGKRGPANQIYITRNCMFEPNQFPARDVVPGVLQDIKTAFFWKKPAIISSHRVNFAGAIDKSNRDSGLKHLKNLLQSIKRNWPDVEFMPFAELGKQIAVKK